MLRFYVVAPEVTRAGLHAFRHGNATIMDGLNVPMRLRQDRLGHEKAERPSALLMQSDEMIEELQTKSARFFAQLCPNRLRLMQVTLSIYNAIAVKFFSNRDGAVPKW